MDISRNVQKTLNQLLGLFLCIGVVLTSDISTKVIETKFTQISSLHILSFECAALCALDSSCSGYIVTADVPCTLIDDGEDVASQCASPQMACYGKDGHGPAEVFPEPCVEAARTSGTSGMYVSYVNSKDLPKYSSFSGMLSNTRSSTKDRSMYYPDIPATIVDLYHIFDLSGMEYDIVIYGDQPSMVEYHDYSGGSYVRVPNTLVGTTARTVKEEYGNVIPDTLHAADIQENINKVYLINDNTVYELQMDTEPPACTYTFLQQFTLKDPSNPFPPSSGVVPQWIRALLVHTDQVIAFSGANVHRYDRATGVWVDHGPTMCF